MKYVLILVMLAVPAKTWAQFGCNDDCGGINLAMTMAIMGSIGGVIGSTVSSTTETDRERADALREEMALYLADPDHVPSDRLKEQIQVYREMWMNEIPAEILALPDREFMKYIFTPRKNTWGIQ